MPTTVVTIGGVARSLSADGILAGRLTPHVREGCPTFEFSRRGIALGTVDPYNGKPVVVTIDEGSGAVTYFSGDVLDYNDRYTERGWVRDYRCYSLRNRMDYVSVIDDNTTTDTIRFNLPGDDPDYLGSRAGRTVGQCILEALEQSTNSTNLIAAGVGAYTSSGTGAAAHCTLTGGVVDSTIVVDSGGSGWTTAPTVVFIGGNPATPATGTATVAAGAVTAITRTSGGSGYHSVPTVVLSRLPAATITDLSTTALSLIPPFECSISGEKLGQALESFLKKYCPNHYLHVQHSDGALRFLDPRTFTARTITLNASNSRWDMPALRRTGHECYSRVVIQGQPLTEPALFSEAKGTLQKNFSHDGLNDTQAIAAWRLADYQQPGLPAGQASGTPTTAAGKLTAITPQLNGYGYTPSSTVAVTITCTLGSGGVAPVAHGNTDASGAVTSYTVTNQGNAITSVPVITVITPTSNAGNADSGTCTCPNTTTVRITSVNVQMAWPANFWDQTYTGKAGVLFLTYSAGAGLTQVVTRRVTANTSLTAAGTSDLTVDIALPNTNFDSYVLVGTMAGSSPVWRRYKITDATQGRAMARRFAFPVPFQGAAGNAVTLTSGPTSDILYSSNGNPPYLESFLGFSIDPDAGTITFDRPVVTLYGTTANLNKGGSATDGIPADVRVFVPINKGANRAIAPANDVYGASQYSGTFWTVECGSGSVRAGRTLTIQQDEWRDPSNQANMNTLASEYLDSVKDTVVEGSISYFGLYSEALTPGNTYAIGGTGFSTPWSGINNPCVSATLEWVTGPEGSLYRTSLDLSTRRAFASGAAYVRPSVTGGSIMLDVQGPTALGSGAAIGGDFFGMTGMGAASSAAGQFQGAAGAAASQFGSAAGSAFDQFSGASGSAFDSMQGSAGASFDQFQDGTERGSDSQLIDPADAGFSDGAGLGSGPVRGAGAEARRMAGTHRRLQNRGAIGHGKERAAAALANYYQTMNSSPDDPSSMIQAGTPEPAGTEE